MKAAIRSSALARIFLVAGFGVAMSMSPASAQKSGGSITVGLELDIPGFDPLKVGVLRYLGGNRRGRDFRYARRPRRQWQAGAEAGVVLDPFG